MTQSYTELPSWDVFEHVIQFWSRMSQKVVYLFKITTKRWIVACFSSSSSELTTGRYCLPVWHSKVKSNHRM